jgi:hypothetical protein
VVPPRISSKDVPTYTRRTFALHYIAIGDSLGSCFNGIGKAMSTHDNKGFVSSSLERVRLLTRRDDHLFGSKPPFPKCDGPSGRRAGFQ